VEDQGGAAGNGKGDAEHGSCIHKVVRVLVVEEGKAKKSDMDHDPQTKEDGASPYQQQGRNCIN